MMRKETRYRKKSSCHLVTVDGPHDDQRHSEFPEFGWLPDGYVASHRAPYDVALDVRESGRMHWPAEHLAY